MDFEKKDLPQYNSIVLIQARKAQIPNWGVSLHEAYTKREDFINRK